MNWLESLIYGLISGLSAFLPISTTAHQSILLKLFGESGADPLLDLLVHVTLIFSVFTAGRNLIDQLRRQSNYYSRRGVHTTSLELRFLKNTIFPFVIAYLLLNYCIKIQYNLLIIAAFLLINGLLLFLQSRMIKGNKDDRSMSVFDSVLTGIAGATAVFPGISHIGAMLTMFTARGVDKQKAIHWVILLAIPALVVFSFKDILYIISGAGNGFISGNVLGYLLAIIGAYAGGYFSVMLMKSLSAANDYQGFAYYSWGASLFSFVLYLTIV